MTLIRRSFSIALLLALACARHETHPYAKTAVKKSPPKVQKPAEPGDTSVGAKMPGYHAKLLDGSAFDLTAQRGNVVFLNLWATWCGPCRFEIPELEQMHRQYAAKGLKVVGVSLDEGGVDAVKEFVTQQKMTYPIVLDPEGNLANVFQTSVIPTSVLIDRRGTIVWKNYGAVSMSDSALKRALEKALNEKG